MPFRMLHQTVKPGQTASFDFGINADVKKWLVGISYWQFEITASGDHHVQILGLSLQTDKHSKNTITSRVDATFSDASGHNIDSSSSSVTVCCVAMVDRDDTQFALANVQQVRNAGQSASIPMPSATLGITLPFLSGFDLRYAGKDDHHLQRLWAGAGFMRVFDGGAVTAVVGMNDSSGHNADATINGGLIAGSSTATGLLVKSLNNKQTLSPIEVNFSSDLLEISPDKANPFILSEAVVLLQNINIQFPGGNHHVKGIGGGTPDWSVKGSTVTLTSAHAGLWDNSRHTEGAGTDVNVLVVAVPMPAPTPK